MRRFYTNPILTYYLITIIILFSLSGNKLIAQTGIWTPLTNKTPLGSGSGGLTLLLSDGTVMAKSTKGGSKGTGWMKLTPDINGSYKNGTWTVLASMASDRLYFSSQILQDGRVYVAGGEYGDGNALVEVYEPTTNKWTSITAPGAGIGDANSEILPDGRVLQAMISGNFKNTYIFNPKTNSFTAGPSILQMPAESAWVKLADNSILQVDFISKTSERYIPSLNQWVKDADVPVDLYATYNAGGESGTAFLLPDGRAFFTGGPSNTAYYTPSGTTAPGKWIAGPQIPNAQGQPDAPGAMMVNGKILFAVNPIPTDADHFLAPTSFYEFDYLTNKFTRINGPSGNLTENYCAFVNNMLALPDGTVLYSTQNSNQFYIYTPAGAAISEGKPTISKIRPNKCDGSSYTITGTKFNGISEGACYGDDWQMASNYPIVRLTSGTNVYYARTTNWNSTGVARGTSPDTAIFTLPSSLAAGTYSLVVTSNGFSSDPVTFTTSTCNIPVVKITSPANNTVLTNIPSTVNITATATVPQGSVTKVEFYNGSILIGTDTISPYTLTWTNVAEGTYKLTAKGYSDSEDTTRSTVVNITVGNQKPIVVITSPANNTIFPESETVNITATASDPDGTISKVEFYSGNTLLGTVNSAPYNYSWTNVMKGTYQLTAKAYDDKNNSETSTITIQVKNQAPTVVVTSPGNNEQFNMPDVITMYAAANDIDGTISKVEFYNGNSLLGTATTSPYSYTWTGATVGSYSITAKAYDNLNLSTTSAVITISVNYGCSASTWKATSIYSGDGTLGTGKGEIVSYNGKLYRALWWTQNDVPAQGGPWTAVGTCSATNMLPFVSITGPATNAQFSTGASINITASASDQDGTISKVDFYAGSTLLGSNALSPYSFSWTNAAMGTYHLTAVCTDDKGSTYTSSIVNVTVTDTTITGLSNALPNEFSLFPNPTDGIVYFTEKVKSIILFDLLGDKLGVFANTQFIDLIDYKSGVYVIRMESESKTSFIRVMKK